MKSIDGVKKMSNDINQDVAKELVAQTAPAQKHPQGVSHRLREALAALEGVLPCRFASLPEA